MKKSYIPDGLSNFDSFTEPRNVIQYSLRDLFQNNQLMSNYSLVMIIPQYNANITDLVR